jgi:hypothetical protein
VEYVATQLDLVIKHDTDILKRFTKLSTWNELILEAQLTIVQFDHLMDDGMPTMPHFIRVASVSAKPSSALPQDLETVVSKATSGVIYMSFGGSVTYELIPSVLQKFLDAFGQLNQTILARVKVPEGMIVPGNV